MAPISMTRTPLITSFNVLMDHTKIPRKTYPAIVSKVVDEILRTMKKLFVIIATGILLQGFCYRDFASKDP